MKVFIASAFPVKVLKSVIHGITQEAWDGGLSLYDFQVVPW